MYSPPSGHTCRKGPLLVADDFSISHMLRYLMEKPNLECARRHHSHLGIDDRKNRSKRTPTLSMRGQAAHLAALASS